MGKQLDQYSDEDIIKMQQDAMAAREKSDTPHRERLEGLQFELDKRAARAQFGKLTPAQRKALAEMGEEE